MSSCWQAQDPGGVLTGPGLGNMTSAMMGRSPSTAHGTIILSTLIGLSVLTVLPIWLTEYPPIQDWPQHLAAVRVLHSYSDPQFGFSEFFRLAPTDTQYLTVYYLASVLAYPIGIVSALKLVASISIAALPLTMFGFCRSLGRSGSSAMLALPLAYNAHAILGFLNFVAALPLMMLALTLAARQRAAPHRRRLLMLSAVLTLCFYTHVVPFALALAGSALIIGGASAISRRRLLPLVGIGVVTMTWFLFTPAGGAVQAALGLGSAQGRHRPVFASVRENLQQMPLWLTDVWRGGWDRVALQVWCLLAATWIVAGMLRGSESDAAAPAPVPAYRLIVLPTLCLVAYFTLPASYSWIWPINTRFLLLTMLLSIPLIRDAASAVRHALALAAGALTVVTFVYICRAFVAYNDEMGNLHAASDQIPPRSKVAGLIWSRTSRVVEFAPFLHSVAYHQVERGGAVMFTFADFPQSPFHFRDDNRPPRVRPRWEWTPERVSPDADLEWYDWILGRGGPRNLRNASGFSLVYDRPPWRVWKRNSGQL